jgi:hypothetical protein
MLDTIRRFSLHVITLPRLRGAHWIVLALCLAIGAGANLYRTALRPSGEATVFRGFFPTPGQVEGQAARWSRGYSKAEVLGYPWRPLRWRVQVTAPPTAPPSGAAVTILVNDVPAKHAIVPLGRWETIEFTADASASTDVAVQFRSNEFGEQGLSVGVGRVSVGPVFTVRSVLVASLGGALAGFALWLLLLVRPVDAKIDADADPHAPSIPTRPHWSLAHATAVLLIVWIYLGIWAVLKPPLQSPDEPQHFLRAESVLLQPWATPTPNVLTLDPRFVNPIVRFPTVDIGSMFFNGLEHLTYDRIARLKTIPWLVTLAPDLVPFGTPLATYPTGYYGSVFLLGEATTKVLGLTPYQNTYAYRAWTVVITGLLWLAVYRVLLVTPGVQRHARLLFAFLLLNPMLAFVSSSVTPDAVNVPLATLGILLTYRTLMTGRDGWLATIALIACGLTKPSILLIFASLPLPALLLWRQRVIPFRHLVAAGIAVARAAVILYCAFYAWSPPRFFASTPVYMTIGEYLEKFPARLVELWIWYWGDLGWLDYKLDDWWYAALFTATLIAAAVAVWRLSADARRFAIFAALFGLGYFACMMAGEYWYLATAGYNFQGRHLFPACLVVAGLVIHEHRLTRWGMVGLLGLINVLLMYESIVRYFGGDWGVFWASLP